MLSSFRCWFVRFAAFRARRRLPARAVLRLERLEDRLAPAGLALDFARPVSPVLLAATYALLNPQAGQDSLPYDKPGADLLALALLRHRSDAPRLSAIREGVDNHPFLSALAAHFLGQTFAAVSSPSPPGNLGLEFSALETTQNQNALAATMLPLSSPSTPTNSTFLSPFFTPPGQPAASSALPSLPADLPHFSAPKTTPAKPADERGSSSFELSPFAPLGLGIVPVPLPRGLEESVADLYDGGGLPPSGSTESLLAENGNSDDEALRAAVWQLLHGDATLALPQSAKAKPQPVERTIPSPPLPDGPIPRGSPVDSVADTESEEAIPSTPSRSLLILLAAGFWPSRQLTQPVRRGWANRLRKLPGDPKSL
jgi:hypothetical protein